MVNYMKISIGTLSKAFDLSDEALRFYEKKGLIHPSREGRCGYRVFERADIQRIANIKRLKNQSFSLDEIHSVYSCIDEEALQSLYAVKIREAQREIDYRLHIMAHMQETMQILKDAPVLLHEPRPLRAGTVYVLEYPSIEAMWARLPKEPTLKELFRQLPLTSFTTLVKKEALMGGRCDVRKGILLFEQDADVLGIDRAQFRRIEAQRAIGCLFRLENGVFDVQALLSLLGAYLKGHGLRACDDLFTAQLISFVDGEARAIHYARMIVPVTGV